MQAKIMQVWLRASALAAVVSAAAALQATATDLYNGYPPPPRTGSAYDDPRYADLYGHTPPPPAPYEDRRYAAPYPAYPAYPPPPRPYGFGHPPIPREPIYRDDYRAPRQFSDARPYSGYRAYSAGPGCLGKDEIGEQLARDGWRDFHDPQVIDQGSALVKARRNGRTFQLKVDRCSGDVIGARPLEFRPGPYAGPYADYERPYRRY